MVHDDLATLTSANASLSDVRFARERRGSAVQWMVKQTHALHRDHHIEWELLPHIPEWVLVDGSKREELFLLAGAVLSVEQIQQWIDGALLKTLATCLGELRLSKLLLIEPSWHVVALVLDKPNALRYELILRGASVMAETAQSNAARDYLKNLFPQSHIKLSFEQASLIASHTLELAQLVDPKLVNKNLEGAQ